MFRFQTIMTPNPDESEKNMMIYLVIVFDASLKEKYFVQHNPSGLWIPNSEKKCDPIGDIIRENIGEYTFLFRTISVKLLPSDEKTAEKAELFGIDQLKTKYITLDRYHYETKTCVYCGHTDAQCVISKCTSCMTTHYCSKICQRAHFPVHKLICKRKNIL
jgi:hypothetical protein